MIDKLLRWLSKISIRLLAFNILLVFLPAAGVLFLDTYEQHLLKAQEDTMVQEGRLLAAAIEASGRLNPEEARQILVYLRQRHEARLRVIDSDGNLVADSARLGPRRTPTQEQPQDDQGQSSAQANQSPLYRLGSLPFRLLRRFGAPSPSSQPDRYDTSERLTGPEIDRALSGRYGASTRISGGDPPTVTLYSAIPIIRGNRVLGAVVVSQSTSRILYTLYAVRLDVFKVFLASLGAAVVLTLLVSTTIARPLGRLRRQAEAILDRKGRLRGGFLPSRRRDEIGELERALSRLTRRLEEHIQSMESFASDVSHEFKNPLASIRTATEMALEVDKPEERRHFLTMIQSDVARMERLLTGVREVSLIDARLGQEERQAVHLEELLPAIVDGFRLRLESHGPIFILAIACHDLVVSTSADRLTQVFENILDNAVSFSPPKGKVTLTVRSVADRAVVSVADEGPGIPEEHRQRVFSRFFSYRSSDQDAANHTGIGLAIVKAIVEGYGGTLTADNASSGSGAVFTVQLPRISSESA
jgi:two-component system sensor histidine kinase ChvG